MELLAPILSQLELIQAVATYRCSRRCTYCYNELLGQDVEANRSSIAASLNWVLDNCTKEVQIEIIGGEPLLPSAQATTDEVIEIGRKHQHGGAIALNSAAIEYRHWNELLPRLDALYMSVDVRAAPAERNWKPFDRDRISLLAEECDANGCRLSISVTLSGHESVQEVFDFVRRLGTIGIREIGFAHVAATGRSPSQVDRYVELFYNLLVWRLLYSNSQGKEFPRLGGLILENLELSLTGGRRVLGCGCGVTTLVIEPDGSFSSGVFGDHQERRTMNGADFALLQEERRSALMGSDPCRQCKLRAACQGGCIEVATVESRNLSAREIGLCQIQLGVMRRVDEDLREAHSNFNR